MGEKQHLVTWPHKRKGNERGPTGRLARANGKTKANEDWHQRRTKIVNNDDQTAIKARKKRERNKSRMKQKQPPSLQTNRQTEMQRKTHSHVETQMKTKKQIAPTNPNAEHMVLDQLYEENKMKAASSLGCNGNSNGKLFGPSPVVQQLHKHVVCSTLPTSLP